MTHDERKQVTQALVECATLFDAEMSEAKVLVWLRAVDDLPAEGVVAALRRAERTSRYLPRPGEIREALAGSTGDAAANAWAEACRITRLYRPEERDKIASPEMREAVRLIGGWQRIGATKEEHLGFVEKDFLERYPGAVARSASGLALPNPTPGKARTINGMMVVEKPAAKADNGLERIG